MSSGGAGVEGEAPWREGGDFLSPQARHVRQNVDSGPFFPSETLDFDPAFSCGFHEFAEFLRRQGSAFVPDMFLGVHSGETDHGIAQQAVSFRAPVAERVDKAGAELLFDVIATAYERNSLIVTTNLPFENWTEVLGSERLTGAALDRLTHRCHILETKGESYRLQDAKHGDARMAERPTTSAPH